MLNRRLKTDDGTSMTAGVLLAILLLVIPAEIRGQSAVPKTPALSGIVVDALTGKPVGGVDVTLRASLRVASFGGGGDKPLRYENSTTSPDGRFRFPARAEAAAAGALASISEISLSVNRTFISVAQMLALSPTETWRTSDGLSDVTWLAQHGTLADVSFARDPSAEFQVGRLQNKSYFPVSVQFLRDCYNEWAAACLTLSPNAGVRIPLIPVLNDPAGCARIADAETQQRCRELNTYQAAFLHRETIAQVRQDKKLCESVDHGRASRECLEHLHNDVRLRAPPQGSLTPPPEMDPIENAMVLTPVAGLVVGSPRLDEADLFDETATYSARYSSATAGWGVDPILAVVDVLSAEPASKDSVAMTTLERGTVSIVTWSSGRRMVRLEFEHAAGVAPQARAVDAAAAGWPELIRAYLRKYPAN